MAAILNLYQAASPDYGSGNLRSSCCALTESSPFEREGWHKGKQVLLLCVINYEISKLG
jgi:hypothetical protein